MHSSSISQMVTAAGIREITVQGISITTVCIFTLHPTSFAIPKESPIEPDACPALNNNRLHHKQPTPSTLVSHNYRLDHHQANIFIDQNLISLHLPGNR